MSLYKAITYTKIFRSLKSKLDKDDFLSVRLTDGNAKRFLYFYKMFEKTKNLAGAVVECGVGMGRTFQMLGILSQIYRRSLWGFDSFAGYPMPGIEDQGGIDPRRLNWKFIKEGDVPNVLRLARLSEDFIKNKVKTVKGFFRESLTTENISKIGDITILHLDIGLYDAYQVCLEKLFPRVAVGGVIMFDEYKNPRTLIKTPGASKAIDEYLGERKSEISRDELSGKYFFVK